MKMIPNDKIERYRMIQRMLEKIADVMTDPINFISISKWEEDFFFSITEQFQMKGTLSDAQCEKLEQIYDKL